MQTNHWSSASLLALLLLASIQISCNKTDTPTAENSRNPEPKKPAAILPPLGVELSRTEGVSIIRVNDTPNRERLLSWSEKEFTAKPHTLDHVLVWIYDRYPTRMDIKTSLPDGLYNIRIKATQDDWPNLRTLAAGSFKDAFGLVLQLVDEKVEVLVLSRDKKHDQKGLMPTQAKTHPKHVESAHDVRFTATDMDDLADWLEKNLGKRIVNETALNGAYDFTLRSTILGEQNLIDALPLVGLRLDSTQRTVQMLRITAR